MMVSAADDPREVCEMSNDALNAFVDMGDTAVTRRASRFCSMLHTESSGASSSIPDTSAESDSKSAAATPENAVQKDKLNLNTSQQPTVTERGRYKFHSTTWRRLCPEDVVALNTALLGYKASTEHASGLMSEQEMPTTQPDCTLADLMSRFFPDHPLSARAVASVHLTAVRGHPVTVEFSGVPPHFYETLLASTSVDSPSSAVPDPTPKSGDEALNDSNAAAIIPHQLLSTNAPPTMLASTLLPCTLHPVVASEVQPAAYNFSHDAAEHRHAKTSAFFTPRTVPPTSTSTSPSAVPLPCASSSHQLSLESNTELEEREASPLLQPGPKIQNSVVPLPTFQVTFEFSAGLCVTRCRIDDSQRRYVEALVIKRNEDAFYEVPKGHLEQGETLQQAAERELREETGLLNPVRVLGPILSEIYTVKAEDRSRIEKTVHYFGARLEPFQNPPACCPQSQSLSSSDSSNDTHPLERVWTTDTGQKSPDFLTSSLSLGTAMSDSPAHASASLAADAPWFGSCESATRSIRWVTHDEARTVYWKSNTIRKVVLYSLREHANAPESVSL